MAGHGVIISPKSRVEGSFHTLTVRHLLFDDNVPRHGQKFLHCTQQNPPLLVFRSRGAAGSTQRLAQKTGIAIEIGFHVVPNECLVPALDSWKGSRETGFKAADSVQASAMARKARRSRRSSAKLNRSGEMLGKGLFTPYLLRTHPF